MPACLLLATAFAQGHDPSAAEKLGAVHFETSCAPAAQVEFDRGVGLLHQFQFERAQDAFHGAVKADESCGIAYWGLALAEWSNPFDPSLRPEAQLRAGSRETHLGDSHRPRTQRERAFLTSVDRLYMSYDARTQQWRMEAYRDTMAVVAKLYPQDLEAQIFYALALAAAEPHGDKQHKARLKARVILEKILLEEPTHPGLAHYIKDVSNVPGGLKAQQDQPK